MTSQNTHALRRLHYRLALAAVVSLILPWASTVRAAMNEVETERVFGWEYPGAKLLMLLLVAGLVISLLEKHYGGRARCAQVALFVANLLAGIGSSMAPFMRGNVVAPIWGFLIAFLLLILFHSVSIMLSDAE